MPPSARPLTALLLAAAAALSSCVGSAPPAPERVRATAQPLTASCADASDYWSPPSAVTRLPVDLDITDCYASSLTAGLTADAAHAAVEGCYAVKLADPLHDACREGPGMCCLSPDEWSAIGDHGVGINALIDPVSHVRTNRWVLRLQLRRMAEGEAPAVWQVKPLSGAATMWQTVAASTGDLVPPDCGESSCPDVSAWKQGAMIGATIGQWPVMAVSWIPATLGTP